MARKFRERQKAPKGQKSVEFGKINFRQSEQWDHYNFIDSMHTDDYEEDALQRNDFSGIFEADLDGRVNLELLVNPYRRSNQGK